jgi:hypothetical protein
MLSPIWSRLVVEQEPSERNRLTFELVALLQQADVHELVGFCATGTIGEKSASMSVLRALALRNDPRFSAGDRASWLGVVGRMVESEYPRPGISRLAFNTLYRHDLEAAIELLTKTINLSGAVEIDHVSLVTDLGDLGSKGSGDALTRLAEIRAMGGPAGERAGAMLDRFDPKKQQERLESLAREWRDKRTASLLGDLYHGPLGGLLVRGIKRKDLIELLRPPDRKREGMIWYVPSDATALSIEFDKKGKAIGWHMT